MDRNQLLNDTETAFRYALDGRQATLWTAMPGIVKSVDFDAMTLEVQPAIQGVVTNADSSTKLVNLPLLLDVPICFPSAGGFSLTFPIAEGDEVLVIIASRCIDAWWQNGGVGVPIENRMHDLSDGFAIPGPKSQPNVISGISSGSVQLRDDAGTFYLGLNSSSGKFQMQNPSKSLKAVLEGLTSIQSDMNTALITFATGLTPVTIVAKAAALVSSLTLVTTSISTEVANIGQLLE